MHYSSFITISAAASLAVILAACGGGGGSDDSGSGGTNYTLIGKVIDGYIKGAKVCVDLNANDACDAAEPSTMTSESGSYSLSYASSMAQGLTPVLVEVPYGATDSGVPVVRAYAMRSMASHAAVISPFTTSAYYALRNNILYQKSNPGTMDSVWSAQANSAMSGFVPDLRSDHVASGNAALNSAAKYAVAALQHQGSPGGVMNSNFWEKMSLDLKSAIAQGYSKPNASPTDVANFSGSTTRPNVSLSTLGVNLSDYPQTVGLAVDSSGALYFASAGTATQSSKIMRLAPGSTQPVQHADAGGSVKGLAMDADDVLYFTVNNTVMRASPTSSVVQLVAGSGAAGKQDGTGAAAIFDRPTYLTIDKNKQVYVVDQSGSRIREIKKVNDTYVVSTLKNSLNQEFVGDNTQTIYKANSGNFYASDNKGNLVVYSPQLFDLLFLPAEFNNPQNFVAIVSDVGDRLYFLDKANHRIWQMGTNANTTNSGFSYTFGNLAGQNGFAGLNNVDRGRFNQPSAMAISKQGEIFIMDSGNKKIRKIN